MFLKKGVNKAQGQNIYPHPNQTKTGNCAAYTGAACLYAFGLDHESALIPQPTGNPSAGEKFQWQMQKMIERLTELIYTQGNSVAEGYRKYIDDAGLNCKFDVSEQPLTSYEYDSIAGEKRHISRLPWLIDQLKQCQDIMLHIKYGGSYFSPNRHSVGLVGVDEATHEIIINNPWGWSTHVNPDDAAANLQNGTTEGFTRHKWRVDGDGYVYFPFDGDDDNFIYEVVMICPVQQHAVAVRGESHALPNASETFASRAGVPAPVRRRYEYTVTNNQLPSVHGLAVQFPGLDAASVVATAAPSGWTSGPWYRERELGFDMLAPEIVLDKDARTFAGVIWRRTGEIGIAKGNSLGGFRVDIQFPDEDEKERARWHDDPLGHAIVLQEMGRTPQAWHVSTLAPRKRPLRMRPDLKEPADGRPPGLPLGRG